MERSITICGTNMTVEFDWSPYQPATWDDPAEGGEVEILNVLIGDQEVTDLLDDKIVEMIQEHLEELIPAMEQEERMCAAESAWEAKRELYY